MKKLIVIMDRGSLHGYQLVGGKRGKSDRIQTVHSHDNVEAHIRFGRRVTDQAGRFPAGNGGGRSSGGMSRGEHHNFEIETEKRLIQLQAETVKELLNGDKYDGWYLAAPQSMNQRVLDQLDPSSRERLEKNLAADLTKVHPQEILSRFKEAEPVS